jgi:hypothetical protein
LQSNWKRILCLFYFRGEVCKERKTNSKNKKRESDAINKETQKKKTLLTDPEKINP